MRALKLLVVCLLSSLGVLVGCCVGLAVASQSTPFSSTEISPALVVPGAQVLLGGEQLRAQRATELANPLFIEERRASRTRYMHMGAQASAQLAGATFPALVDRRAGGPPSLPAGERIVGYEAGNVARVELPGGQHGLVESLRPMSTPEGHGHFAPIDLALRRTGDGYAPVHSDVAVQIPSRLSAGVDMPSDGVSLTPVEADGHALEGSSGAIDGAATIYTNTQSSTDTLVKPLTGGFEMDALLRSVDSPQTLYFTVGMPAGAKLVGDADVGDARVVFAGQTLATIARPVAQDAVGTSVPVTMHVHEDTLVLTVADHSGEYTYPIEVDPTAYDSTLGTPSTAGTNWQFYGTNGKYVSYPTGYGVVMAERGNYVEGEHDEFSYGAHGSASVVWIEEESEGGVSSASGVVTKLEFAYGSYQENALTIAAAGQSYGRTMSRLCVPREGGECGNGKIDLANNVRLIQTTTKSGTEAYGFWDELYNATVGIQQTAAPTASFNNSEAYLANDEGRQNVLYGSGSWLGEHSGAFEIKTADTGVGVSDATIRTVSYGPWGFEAPILSEGHCSGLWCAPSYSAHFTYNKEMQEGENQIEVCAEDAVRLKTCKEVTLKVDNKAPSISLSGIAESGAELSAAPHKIKISATDGSSPNSSSGVKSVSATVDGVELGTPAGSCSPGRCTVTGTWTIKGETLGAGEHKLVVTAFDNANNEIQKEYTFAIRKATPIAVGPGSLDPETGQLVLKASDVDQGGAGAVSRTYSSRVLGAGSVGPLGSQWSLNVGPGQTIVIEPNGNAELRGAAGGRTTFVAKEGTFTAPSGDGNLTLESKTISGKPAYLLKNTAAGHTTRFTQPSGSQVWVPTVVEGPSETKEIVKIGYRVVEGGTEHAVTEPTEILAPLPTGVSCGKNPEEVKLEELKAGCRALTFAYAEKTTASGEGSGGWGEYTGRLAGISFTAQNPVSKEMKTTAVAQYSYDLQGRLRAEWDPRLAQPLKTTYGYDAEGHVTAVVPPKQEPWTFTYGTTSLDASPGRLIKTMRPPASTKLPSTLSAPVNSEKPVVTGTATPGARLATSVGKWQTTESSIPITYAYQWEDCNKTGGECTSIGGANNPNYTVTSSDVGYSLVAQVSATNGDGTVASASVPHEVIAVSIPTYSSQFGTTGSGKGQMSNPWGIAASSAGNIWVSDTGNNRVDEFNSEGAWIRAIGFGVSNGESKFESCTATCQSGLAGTGNGQFQSPEAITLDSAGNVWVADSGNNRLEEFTAEGAFIKTVGSVGTAGGQFSGPEGLTFDSKGNLWVADAKNNRVEEFNEKAEFVRTFGYGVSDGETKFEVCASSCRAGVSGPNNGQMDVPGDVAVDSSGDVWVDDVANERIEEFNSSLEYVTQCGSLGSGNGQFSGAAWRMSIGPGGYLWVSDSSDNKVQVFSPSCTYAGQFGTAGTGNGQFTKTGGAAIYGASVYVLDKGNPRVEKWSIPGGEGELRSPEPGTTIEYQVPLSGSAAPYQMTSTEIWKWHQADLPAEATAVFPPDEPMRWPASDYKRAAVTYMDLQGRTVDVAAPGGGISTTEYNSLNEVTRTLSAVSRATALNEGSKSGEISEKLSTKKIYNASGSELLETYGPEHKIKLANGSEEETRNREKFTYNEKAPTEEAHNLVTTATSWSETAAKQILEEHKTTTSYEGQEQLGWKLRKPTLVSSEANGQTTMTSTTYESGTGAPLEALTSVSSGAPFYASQFGAAGTGNGQFKAPSGAALDAHGNVWVADRANNRVQELTAQGQFIAAYGSEGTAGGQFKGPEGIAINQATGNVYVTDSGNNRVQELSSEGKFVAAYGFGVSNGEAKFEVCTSSCRAGVSGSGEGQFNDPMGVALDGKHNVWVVDRANSRLEEFSPENSYLAKYGGKGTLNRQFKEPSYIAVSGGNVYISDTGNDRVQEISAVTGAFVAQFGSSGSGPGQFGYPYGIASNPSTGTLYVGDPTNSRVEEFAQSGAYMAQFGSAGTGNGQLKEPSGIAAGPANEIYVLDSGNSRVQIWERPSPAPIYTSQFGNGDFAAPVGDAVDAHGNVWVANAYGNSIEEFASTGSRIGVYGEWGAGSKQVKEPIGIAINASTGNVYVGDNKNNRVDELNEKGEFVSAFGYGVSNGEEKLQICTTSCRAGLSGAHAGEFNEAGWVAIDSSGNIWVGDESNNRVQEFNNKDEFLRTFGFGVSNGKTEFQVCTSACQSGIAGSGNGQLSNPTGIAVAGGRVYVGDLNNSRVEMFSPEGAYLGQFGTAGAGNGQFKHVGGVATDAIGNVYVADIENARVEEFTATGVYVRTIGSVGTGNGQFGEVEGIAFDKSGDMYAVDSNGRVEEWAAAPNPGNEGARNIKTTYYTAAANSEYPACGGHPEWAPLACQTEPAVQPGDSGPPQLPVTTTTYNMWDEPETIIEKFGSVTRTTKRTYDSAGRETANEETSTSSEDASLPSVTKEYNSESGEIVKQEEVIGGKAKTIASVYNALGQLASYTDGEGATTTYAYDSDGRVEEISEAKGRQVYSYDPTTGFLTKLFDTVAGTFTASYDAGGEMLTEGYPNGMAAKYTYNSVGQATGLEYEKTTHCSEKCVWFSDSEAFGANSELASQVSTLSSEAYSYNENGQLTRTQETPVGGKGCVTRLYGYSEESGQRESLTTREPNEKGECATEGGVVEGHFYDSSGRLLDPGVGYDALGNITKVPAVDAGGSAITSSFYLDGQAAVQQQGEKTVEYSYDPEGRAMVAKLKAGSSTTTTISHYGGPGNALMWTCEEAGGCKTEAEGKWTRNIPGIGGALDAIQVNGGAPVLQLHDLQGNIVATAAISETAEGLLSTHNSTEFGVPVGTAPKYSWLGAEGANSELGTGVITSGGMTYVPQLATTLQTEQPIPPGATPNGSGTGEIYRTYESQFEIEGGNAAAAQTLAEQRTLELEAELAGDGIDPTVYLTAYDAERKAAALEKASVFAEIAEALGSVGESIIKLAEGVVLDKFDGIDKINDWYKNTAALLRQCANDIHGSTGYRPSEQTYAEEHNTCRLETRDYEIGVWIFKGTIENFNWEARVSWCTVDEKYCYRIALPYKPPVLA